MLRFFGAGWLTVCWVSVLLSGQPTGFPYQLHPTLKNEGVALVAATDTYFILSLPPKGTTASRWLKRQQSALGLPAATAWQHQGQQNGQDGKRYERLGQQHAGLPVLGGSLIARYDAQQRLEQLAGKTIPQTAFAVTAPGAAEPLSRSVLAQNARRALLSTYPQVEQWNLQHQGEHWATSNPWASPAATTYHRCRVIELSEPGGARAVRLYLDPQSGRVVFRHRLHCGLQRQLHHRTATRASIVWREGDPFPGSLAAEDREMLAATRETFNLYWRSFGRNSYDNQDGLLRAVTGSTLFGCPNAVARGQTILTCPGVVSDDVVGHEWTHVYTSALNGLLFAFESGAIQEGMADIFGEAIDLLNQRGLDTGDQQPRDSCLTPANYRWAIAEDVTAIDTVLRDMWTPACKNDPGYHNSELFDCGDLDGADIHSNSAVLSRTFALLTDGDTTATPPVRGIGLTRALHIFYHANAHYVTPVTDYAALAAILRQAARDLQGIGLPALTLTAAIPPLSGDTIMPQDLHSLDSALLVTRLGQGPACAPRPSLDAGPPPSCPAEDRAFRPVFTEDWETSLGQWTIAATTGDPVTDSLRRWRRTAVLLPDQRPGSALFAPSPVLGDCRSQALPGTTTLTSPPIQLPSVSDVFELRFTHYFATEAFTDGGQLSFRKGTDGPFSPVPASAFSHNAYNGLLAPAPLNDNPLAGQAAFHGTDPLSTTGSWATSVVLLDRLGLRAGDAFQLRWTLGHNGCTGWLGWYLDEISVGYCADRSLPVTYRSLVAVARKAQIDVCWQTEQEENNAGFFVEKHFPGGFRALGFVPADARGNYCWEDTAALPGQAAFYRLRQVDLDGSEALSDVVSATLAPGKVLQVFPNPAAGQFTVRTEEKTLTIHDLRGRLLRRLSPADGRVVVRSLRPGLYLVRSGEEVRRVVVR